MADDPRQFIVVERSRLHRLHQNVEEIALYNADGSAYTGRDEDYAPITTATAIGTAAKTTTSVEPEANTIVPIKFTNGNSAASPTLAFNGGAARAIQLGGVASAAIEIAVAAGGVVICWFDGTILHQFGVVS